MKKEILKNNNTISYSIKVRKGARGIRIGVLPDMSVVVTKPKNIRDEYVHQVVSSKVGWITEQIEKIKQRPKKILAHFSVRDYKLYKQDASDIALERCLYFNKFYNFKIKSIKIRNQKTRWGSCSSSGELSFNYKIFFLPPDLRDYIIVHELAHLKEMNHSQNFWDLVALQIPDYKQRMRDIRLY